MEHTEEDELLALAELADELTDALHNMLGVFDTPIARAQFGDDFISEVLKLARETFNNAKKQGLGMQ